MTDRRTFDSLRDKPETGAKPLDPIVKTALRNLGENGDFRVFLNHFRAVVEGQSVDRAAPNVSALLIIEGRRTLLRDIDRVLEQARSGGPGAKPDPE